MMNVADYMLDVGKAARRASRVVASAPLSSKNAALAAIADSLVANAEEIISANELDMREARSKNIAAPLLDRLAVDSKTVHRMADGVRAVGALSDPVGAITDLAYRPSGIHHRPIRGGRPCGARFTRSTKPTDAPTVYHIVSPTQCANGCICLWPKSIKRRLRSEEGSDCSRKPRP